jgi:hypothetical protein
MRTDSTQTPTSLVLNTTKQAIHAGFTSVALQTGKPKTAAVAAFLGDSGLFGGSIDRMRGIVARMSHLRTQAAVIARLFVRGADMQTIETGEPRTTQF